MTIVGNEFQDLTIAADHGRLSSVVAGMLDPFSIRRWERVGVAESSRCLVIGAGGGAIAAWLAARVGDEGEVVVIDPDPGRVPAHPGVTVLRHDMVFDPLVANPFQLIHVRFALASLPGRRELLAELSAALAPGGVIGCDELDPGPDRCLLEGPDPAARRLFDRFHDALAAVLDRTGSGPRGRPTHRAMCELGLIDVDTEAWARTWRGSQPGSLLLHTLAGRLRDQLIAAGLAPEEVDEFRMLMLDPRLAIRGCLAVSTIGRRPVPVPDPVADRLRRWPGFARSPIQGRAGRPYPARP